MLEHLSSLIIQLIQTTGYIGVFVLMTLESALIPIPSEVTMPFAGFLVNKGVLSFPMVVFAGAFGNLAGSLIAYYIGFYFKQSFIIRMINKYGKLLLITEEDYRTAVSWFHKYGMSVVFFSRLLPAVRTFISLPAGHAKMNVVKFSIYTFIGSLLWSGVLAYIGVYLGSKWHSLESYFRKFDLLIVVVFVVLVALYINHKLRIVPLGKRKK